MKIICVGRNYTEHIEELANEKPDNPVVFIKPDTSILNKEQGFYIPDFSEEVHHEVELLVRINKVGKHIDPKFAHKYYDQISLGIDFTARDLQAKLKEKGLPWEKAKAFDGSALIGEWIDKNEFEDIDKVHFNLIKNSEVVQKGNTAHMLWKIDELISYVSKYFTLKTGDVVFTGTPSGVGKVTKGDYLEGYLEGKKLFTLNIK
ncbi:2-keto-4-pentenoate hydratase/2-oxohepta-3-ene-1,7-dioic acid hydratase (catechol pathway) [Zhouia amylolytica]|uniref:2-keto-4-pentenoate hydratase/2-oxohepta-3-ene-1,7-dioic acid hydratase (Catechol pathway) n=1 Tax=Zhouia amylolytica TaxID=376730 RepID=A0A1I6UXZ1_9FLAO|nr:fumarylacetoacetate hydrolase family protein [Zhouia amylolytica]MCQ0110163.1 fumarylacetoacetate hydrolase family protein [Zhouia amylolytica]SFT06306.1 2-keto-4-pentenoate hydratase/2-oxohepta-3-ene-1,7-dioic acid hydratase (catechol pathway) [Zhouia amylolytica]